MRGAAIIALAVALAAGDLAVAALPARSGQAPGLRWSAALPITSTFLIEGQPVDGGEWLVVASLQGARRCVEWPTMQGSILRCTWGSNLPAGVPGGVHYRIVSSGASLELHQLSVICLPAGPWTATGSVGDAYRIWPLEGAFPGGGCP